MSVTKEGFHYTVEYDDWADCFWISFRYNPALVERIKQLPHQKRCWYSARKQWWIHKDWIDEATRLLEGRAAKSRLGAPPPYTEVIRLLTVDHIELGVLPGVPWEIVESVHRRWAALIHPDLGGDPEMMKKKNIARDNLRKRYGK
jgi:hypothetical protein